MMKQDAKSSKNKGKDLNQLGHRVIESDKEEGKIRWIKVKPTARERPDPYLPFQQILLRTRVTLSSGTP